MAFIKNGDGVILGTLDQSSLTTEQKETLEKMTKQSSSEQELKSTEDKKKSN